MDKAEFEFNRKVFKVRDADLSKNLSASLFNDVTTYRMNLISAGSISLDSRVQ
jgi:hypothetical protein